ncbi:MAG: class I SAM-dependent methyltransferase [Pseudomonadales bacterium]
MIRYRFYAAIPGTCPSADIASFCCDPQDLPIAKGSVSAVALHHVLDCVPDPRQMIREVARITEPGGRLLVCGFNPWGRWGAQSLLDQGRLLTGRPGTGVRPIQTGRLLDWLALLGFEQAEEVRFIGRPLSGRLGRLGHMDWLHNHRQALGASSYIISATKRCSAAQQPPALTAVPNTGLATPAVFRSQSKVS